MRLKLTEKTEITKKKNKFGKNFGSENVQWFKEKLDVTAKMWFKVWLFYKSTKQNIIIPNNFLLLLPKDMS